MPHLVRQGRQVVVLVEVVDLHERVDAVDGRREGAALFVAVGVDVDPAALEIEPAAQHGDVVGTERRERFRKQAYADGYSLPTVGRIAWALLVVAKVVHRNGGAISIEQLKIELRRHVRLDLTARSPSGHTTAIFLHFGEAWLRSIGALTEAAEVPLRFASELTAFSEYMRVERGLSPVTIATQEWRMHRFVTVLPTRIQSLDGVSLDDIDAFLQSEAQRGWSRSSLHALGSSLRCFFRYAAYRGWCRSDLAEGIDLPRLYALEDIPRAPTANEVGRLLEATGFDDDPVKIRDHAVLSLLIYYGLRRGEVERLTLDDVDWAAEKIHITRPKLRRSQYYPLAIPVGDAILRYLRQARPRCSHRALFLTHQGAFPPTVGCQYQCHGTGEVDSAGREVG